jgi:hypothetical protein
MNVQINVATLNIIIERFCFGIAARKYLNDELYLAAGKRKFFYGKVYTVIILPNRVGVGVLFCYHETFGSE